jgi:hypothetical protein
LDWPDRALVKTAALLKPLVQNISRVSVKNENPREISEGC